MTSFWDVAGPNWLQAIGTIGAFLSGGLLLVRELRRDRERELHEQRRQASSVSAWPIRAETLSATAQPKLETRLCLNNASNEPVYALIVHYTQRSSTKELSDEVGLLPPGKLERDLPHELEEIWIKSSIGWLRPRSNDATPTDDPRHEPWNFHLALTFQDATGMRWRRGVDGTVVREVTAS